MPCDGDRMDAFKEQTPAACGDRFLFLFDLVELEVGAAQEESG